MKYIALVIKLNLVCTNITLLFACVAGSDEHNDMGAVTEPENLSLHVLLEQIYLIMFCFRTTEIILHFIYVRMVVQSRVCLTETPRSGCNIDAIG